MKQCDYLSWLVGGIAFSYLTMTSPIQAQIASDGTLPNNSSVKTQGNTEVITGGTKAGRNLFHSFVQFSVPENGVAYFNNAGDIQNIIGRVTGTSVSNINGSLQANGIANLFLLNPNGIIFGPNSSLDIGGSFLASTASSLKFNDGKEFSATDPQATPLLTVSVPRGLQFGKTSGRIRNQSEDKSDDPTVKYPLGLQVKPDKTLALVGGNVVIDGGNLTADGGRIELGSVASNSLVSMNPTDEGWSLSYEGVKNFQDIRLSQLAYVDASGEGGGDIQVQGRRITLTDGSNIGAFTLGTKPGGIVTITASESIELIGVSADGQTQSSLYTESDEGAAGAAPDLKITTKRLIAQDGGQAYTGTSSEGQGGDLTVSASDFVELTGKSANSQFNSGLFALVEPAATEAGGNLSIETGKLIVQNEAKVSTETGGEGPGGNLTIDARQLLVRNGAQILTSTFGQGQAGNLTVQNATEVELIGNILAADGKFVPSGLLATAEIGIGNGGNLSISTEKLIVRDGAQVSATTFDAGNAGNLTVRASEIELVGAALSADGELLKSEGNKLPFSSGLFAGTEEDSTGNGRILDVKTDRLSLRDGAVLQTSTLGAGDAGDLIVRASEFVELIGTTKDSQLQFPTSLIALSGGFPELGLGVSEATGQGGNLIITTGNLLVQDGAEVAVSSINRTRTAKGAGSITIAAPTISLNRGDIRATTASGKGGNIELQVPDVLLLRRNSNISTSAGSAQVDGDGGIIEIDTNFIVAVPEENSDITANAFSGSGGNVDIELQGDIFGLEPRSRQELQSLLEPDDPLDPQRLDSNDITAISQTNPSLSGDVTINTPDVNPSEGVVALPDVPVSVAVAQGCQATGSKQASVEFFNTGKGGLAPSPYEPLSSSETWEDVPQGTKNLAGAPRASDSPTIRSSKIVEAQGWSVNETGEVVLVAEVPSGSSQRRCHLR